MTGQTIRPVGAFLLAVCLGSVLPAAAAVVDRHIFVTSVTGTGDLASWPDAPAQSGLAAGDEICRNRAAAGFLHDAETFVAWPSTSTESAADRVMVDGPFVRVDGFVVAQPKTELLAPKPTIATGIGVTELDTYYLQPVDPAGVWTGTDDSGNASPITCSNWMSASSAQSATVGDPEAAANGWSANSTSACGSARPIYCFSNREQLHWDNFERGDRSRWDSHPLRQDSCRPGRRPWAAGICPDPQ